MQTQKMSLANIKGKLSRDEMKKIMAGSGNLPGEGLSCDGPYGNSFCRSFSACLDCSNNSGYGVGVCVRNGLCQNG